MEGLYIIYQHLQYIHIELQASTDMFLIQNVTCDLFQLFFQRQAMQLP